MEAVVRCAWDNDPPPSALRLAWQCERWHTLPKTGGLYAQDARTITEMTATINMFNALKNIKRAKPKELHKLSEGDRRILKMLMDEKLIFTK